MRNYHCFDDDDRAETLAAMEDALLCRLRGQAANGRASIYRDCKLGQLEVLCRASARTPFGVRLAGASSDFTHLLGNVASRRLLDYMVSARGSARTIARTLSLSDFKPAHAVHLDAPSLEPIGQAGEVRAGIFGETGEPIALSSFGRAVGLSRFVVSGDDVGAVDHAIETLALSALAAEDDAMFALLAANGYLRDGTPLFDASRGNLLGAVPFDAVGLNLATVALRSMTSSSGVRLALDPWALLVGSTLEAKARALLASLSSGAPPLRLIVEPRIIDARFYVLANPAVRAALGLAYLGGQSEPGVLAIESWQRDGVDLRLTHQVGVARLDPRAATFTPSYS